MTNGREGVVGHGGVNPPCCVEKEDAGRLVTGCSVGLITSSLEIKP
jgi:hypothetical protein